MFPSFAELTGGKDQHIFQVEKLNLADKEAAQLHMRKYTLDICALLSVSFSFWPFDICFSICRCAVLWIWGRKYDFLQNMTGENRRVFYLAIKGK
uniref:Uncharacterized protein n=1 Tax=Cyprinus carpio carpio TaxID=630221 RepID=A0A9J8DFU5_CYPCA